MSTTIPYPITAHVDVSGGYSDSFIVECIDAEGTYISAPATFTENCVTSPVSPAVVIPSHYYDPVNEVAVIVENTLTTFFVGSDCVQESDWAGCSVQGNSTQISVSANYPFPVSAVVDFGPGYDEYFTIKCNTTKGKTFTALSSKFIQERDQFKPADDYVHSLPEMENFSFGVYSGYVNLTNSTKSLYYLLTESEQDWKTDPILIWLQGGPGCSSIQAWATENGPWILKEGNTTFEKNPNSWNKRANVLYIDNPAGVGFSSCGSNVTGCVFDDNTVGPDLLNFMEGWYKKFSEYRNHELYLSGESYGGIFVPYFAQTIDWYNGNNTHKPGALTKDIPLKGFAVGNGITNWKYDGLPATMNMTYGRALINDALFDNMTSSNCDFSYLAFDKQLSEVCMELLDQAAILW